MDRALTVLSHLAKDGELGITELANRLGVHKSTAFRLVATLEAHDLVEQNSERGRYRLGIGVVRLAGAAALRLDLVQEARPVCTELAAAVGETVNVVVLSGRDAFYVDQVSGPSALQLHYWVGRRIPLHATSNGKVLLAHAPDDLRRDILGHPIERLTSHTLTDPAALAAELDAVLRDGYALAVDELEMGLTAVAAPITGSPRRGDRLGQRLRPDLPARPRPAARGDRPGEVGRRPDLPAAGLARRPRAPGGLSPPSRPSRGPGTRR